MKTRRFILTLVVASFTMAAFAQSSDPILRDKITNAVMKVYDDQLALDPNDYNTLFARAHQHFYNGDYTQALADVNQAMLLTPKTEKDLRFDEYILRARISEAREDYVSELADLRMAKDLQPKSLACTDMIAKANLKSGNMNAAEKAFKTILRAESMNYDAMYGLAQVELNRGNKEAALEHVNKAVELFHAEPQVYENRSDIYYRSGNIEAATADLVQGMQVGNGGNAIQRLMEISDDNYDGVMRALADLSDKNPNDGTYRYLRANVALDHTRYGQALRDFNYVKRNGFFNGHSVDYNIAKCLMELGRFDEALINVDNALAKDPAQPEYYLVKSLVEFNLGEGKHYDTAMEALNRCAVVAPQYVPMLVAKASLLSAQGNDNEALGYLNAAVANEPADAEARLSRGLLLKKMDNLKLAVKDFNVMTQLSDDVYDLKGFALSELGRDNDMFRWLQRVTGKDVAGGENFYYAAMLMAMRGDNFKAMEYLQKAINNGYGSLYNLQYNILPFLNLNALQSEPDFPLMIEKALPNFTEKQ